MKNTGFVDKLLDLLRSESDCPILDVLMSVSATQSNDLFLIGGFIDVGLDLDEGELGSTLWPVPVTAAIALEVAMDVDVEVDDSLSEKICSASKRLGLVLLEMGVSGNIVVMMLTFLFNASLELPEYILGVTGGSNMVAKDSVAHRTRAVINCVYFPFSEKYLITKLLGGLSMIFIKFLKKAFVNKLWKVDTDKISSKSSAGLVTLLLYSFVFNKSLK